jgi:hypothetical protein
VTKKDRIRELIMGGVTPKEIADEVHTSREYVYKEKGKLKKEGRIVTHQSLSISDGKQKISIIKDPGNPTRNVRNEQFLRLGHDLGNGNYYDIPPLDKNSLISMYDSFDQSDGPVDVIKKYGIHPEICEKEFGRFMVMKSRNPYDLQKHLISRITDPSPAIESIMNKSKTSLLSNSDLIILFDFVLQSSTNHFIIAVLNNPAINIPFGVSRWICSVCQKPQRGVILAPGTSAGSSVRNLGTSYLCEFCRNKTGQQTWPLP